MRAKLKCFLKSNEKALNGQNDVKSLKYNLKNVVGEITNKQTSRDIQK